MRALAVAVLVLAAGCLAPPPADPVSVAEDPILGAAAPAAGAIVVGARFTDLSPLPGVNVTVGNASRLTGSDGTARFDGLPAGPHLVYATKVAHRAAQALVQVEAGRDAIVDLLLAAEAGGQHAHKAGFAGHTDVYRFDGHFDCTAVYVIIPGDCLLVVENVTGMAGAPDPTANMTSERYVIDFPLDAGWRALVVEMNWTEPSPRSIDGMTLALEPAEAPADGHAAKYARVSGASPLRIELVPGVEHQTATERDMPRPEGGEVIRARAFARGHAHHPAGTDFLGVGFATQFHFTLWVSTFYGSVPDAGYSAIR